MICFYRNLWYSPQSNKEDIASKLLATAAHFDAVYARVADKFMKIMRCEFPGRYGL